MSINDSPDNIVALNNFSVDRPTVLFADDEKEDAESFYEHHFSVWPHKDEVNLLWCQRAATAINAINGQSHGVLNCEGRKIYEAHTPQIVLVITDMRFGDGVGCEAAINGYNYHGEAIGRATRNRGIICLAITKQERAVDPIIRTLQNEGVVSEQLFKTVDRYSIHMNCQYLTMYYQRTQYPVRKLLADLFKAATTAAPGSSLDLKHGSQNLAAQLGALSLTTQPIPPQVNGNLNAVNGLSRTFSEVCSNLLRNGLSDNCCGFIKQLCEHAGAIGSSIGEILGVSSAAPTPAQVELLYSHANTFFDLIDSIRLKHAAKAWCLKHNLQLTEKNAIDESRYLDYPVYMIDATLDVLHTNSIGRGHASEIQVTIEYCAEESGAPLKLIFSDNGIGIEPNNNLFAPNPASGSARGLPWVGEHVRSLGGDIVVRTKRSDAQEKECSLKNSTWRDANRTIIQGSGTRIELIFYPCAK